MADEIQVEGNLDKILQRYEGVFSPDLISNKGWNHINKSPDTPFENDRDYMETINALFELRGRYLDLHTRTQERIARVSEKELSNFISLKSAFKALHGYVDGLIEKRIACHDKEPKDGDSIPLKPRNIRLSKVLGLTKKETLAMAFIGLVYTEMITVIPGTSFNFNIMTSYCNLTIPEALQFILPSREHVKQGIFTPDDDDPIGNAYSFKIPYTTSAFLFGMELTEAELLKIDKTALETVLRDEEGSAAKLSVLNTSVEISRDKEDKENSDEAKEEPETQEGDIFDFLRSEVEAEQAKTQQSTEDVPTDDSLLVPYSNNLQYLSDIIDWLSLSIRVKNMTRDLEDDLDRDSRKELKVRELKAKLRQAKAKFEKRMKITKDTTGWIPRLERLATKLQLDNFEKNLLMLTIGNVISSKISPDIGEYHSSSSTVSSMTVGDILYILCTGFEDEINCRKYFYKSSKLVKEGIIRLDNDWERELMNADVEIDRRMLDFVVGLDTEVGELVEGSHLYSPTVDLDQVVLPNDQKELIIRTAKNFENFVKARKKLGFEETISYGTGMLIMFFGKSGTGKTMMANAIAKMLGKKILLVNYPSLGEFAADRVIKFIFREAKLTDAVLFFDECEGIFQTRDHNAGSVNLLLTEIEQHNGLIIMATNRAFDLDEAMHRRITLAIEFRAPDPHLRARIWESHIPNSIRQEADIDFRKLALKFELTGGLIKNAVLSALSEAVARSPENPSISQKDLEQGALYQLRGALAMNEFDRRVVPHRGLSNIIVSEDVKNRLQQIINMEKARQVLFSEWGWSEKLCNDQGTTCLFHGPPGTGKSLAAEVIGFETGKPLKVINCAELESKWVGETAKNIETVFREAIALDAILVFDDAEALFSSRKEGSHYHNQNTSILLYWMERIPGIAILTTNHIDFIDQAFHRRFRFVVKFEEPNAQERKSLWRAHIPEKTPLSADVDFDTLANRYTFSGGVIKNVCFKAASKAALKLEKDKRILTLEDLIETAENELSKMKDKPPTGMYQFSSPEFEILYSACENGNEEELQKLLTQPMYSELINEKTPLCVACSKGHVGIVKLLLAQPHIDVNKGTTLTYAFYSRNIEIVSLLLSHPKIDISRGIYHSLFANESQIEILKLIITHPSIDIKWLKYNSPLNTACHYRRYDAMKYLLSLDIIDVNWGNKVETCLYNACSDGDLEAVNILLSHEKIMVNKAISKDG